MSYDDDMENFRERIESERQEPPEIEPSDEDFEAQRQRVEALHRARVTSLMDQVTDIQSKLLADHFLNERRTKELRGGM